MIEQRIIGTKETATLLGLSYEAFRVKRRSRLLPIEPVPYCKHKYDVKKVHEYLDRIGHIQPKSAEKDYDKIVLERLASHGKHKGEIPAHSHL